LKGTIRSDAKPKVGNATGAQVGLSKQTLPDLFEPGFHPGEVLVDQGGGDGRGGSRRCADHDGCQLKVVGVDFNFYRLEDRLFGDGFGCRHIVLLSELIKGNLFGR